MELETLVGQLAFPIVVALYFMLRMEDTLKQLSNTVQNNTTALVRLLDKMGEVKEPPKVAT